MSDREEYQGALERVSKLYTMRSPEDMRAKLLRILVSVAQEDPEVFNRAYDAECGRARKAAAELVEDV